MTLPRGEPRCTDCGRKLDEPGTCDDCLAANQPEPERPQERKRP